MFFSEDQLLSEMGVPNRQYIQRKKQKFPSRSLIVSASRPELHKQWCKELNKRKWGPEM
jgi:hypothetical protein